MTINTRFALYVQQYNAMRLYEDGFPTYKEAEDMAHSLSGGMVNYTIRIYTKGHPIPKSVEV